MESTVTFALLRPADFVNFAGQGLLFAGRGSLFFCGAGEASLMGTGGVGTLRSDRLCELL